ncbi:MAG: histidine kinase [Bacteroidota bacterium]
MNKLFVHNPWFRLLGPLFGGVLVYFLILLINDAVLYIQEDFLSQELVVCIGLAYLSQEFSRMSLKLFERLKWSKSFLWRVLFQLLISVVLTIVLVTTAIYLYFTNILFYEPSFRELYVFNSIFAFITLLYVILYLGHYFLYRKNTKKLLAEEQAKLSVENDFSIYLKGIHPELLFESLEAMLVTMKESPVEAEELSDYFSSVYRYILSKRKREMVLLEEELSVTKNLVQLFNCLPHRKIRLGKITNNQFNIVPTTLLKIVEAIVRTTIPKKKALTIAIEEKDNHLEIAYEPEEKLQESLTVETLDDVSLAYRFYSESPLEVKTVENQKVIQLPKLTYHENSDS